VINRRTRLSINSVATPEPACLACDRRRTSDALHVAVFSISGSLLLFLRVLGLFLSSSFLYLSLSPFFGLGRNKNKNGSPPFGAAGVIAERPGNDCLDVLSAIVRHGLGALHVVS